jgi:RNA polymerase primary sigma factor
MGEYDMKSIAESEQSRPGYPPETSQRVPNSPRLSRDQEHELAGLVATGDLDARNQFVLANVPLVIKIARDFQGRGLSLDDLIGEGNLGLIHATKAFEPRFGTRFSTYASYWIKQSIRHALINTTSTIRLPTHMVGILTKWRRAERALASELGKTPGFDEVAAALGLSEAQKLLVADARRALCFGPGSNDKTESGPYDLAKSANRAGSGEGRVEADEAHQMLLQRMHRLEKRECTILKLRFGLEGEDRLTLKEIGRRLGVTREWVRKIELRAIRKLRDDQSVQAIDSKVERVLPARRRSVSPGPHGPFRSRCQPGV